MFFFVQGKFSKTSFLFLTTSETIKCADMAVTQCLVDYNHPDQKKYMFCGLAKGVNMCGVSRHGL